MNSEMIKDGQLYLPLVLPSLHSRVVHTHPWMWSHVIQHVFILNYPEKNSTGRVNQLALAHIQQQHNVLLTSQTTGGEDTEVC
jgi:hypothetical protein